MSKYICYCGFTFKNKKDAYSHISPFPPDNIFPHGIIKKNWKGRFLEAFFSYPWEQFFRVLGALMIYWVLIHHFEIDLSVLESSLIGLGIGLLVGI